MSSLKLRSTAGGYDMDARDISEFEDTRGEVMSWKVLQYVPAVKEGRVYVIAVHLLSFFGDSGCRSFISLPTKQNGFPT